VNDEPIELSALQSVRVKKLVGLERKSIQLSHSHNSDHTQLVKDAIDYSISKTLNERAKLCRELGIDFPIL